MQNNTNILVRLPNWLGDVVMATALLQSLMNEQPQAVVDIILPKKLAFLGDYLPVNGEIFLFEKIINKGLAGAYLFGRKIRKGKRYRQFYCLPESLSSTSMAIGIRAKEKIGFNAAGRKLFFSNSVTKPENVHRVREYLSLSKNNIECFPALMSGEADIRKHQLVVNINSEAQSRRLPTSKAIELINAIREATNYPIVLIGSQGEAARVTEVYDALAVKENVLNLAGKTSLPALMELLGNSSLLLTTDSGPAHVANALGTKTIVLFGAGNEQNTRPYNDALSQIIRLRKLACEPCTKNTCRLYPIPECLLQLDNDVIVKKVIESL